MSRKFKKLQTHIALYFHILNRLGIDHDCDGQTDRQTDRTALSNNAF